MAHHGPLWTQSGSYPAQADRSLLAALWPHGGASGGAVTAVLNTPTTSVAPGQAAVPLAPGQGSALCTWDTAEVLDHSPAPASGTSRIDLIVVQVRDPGLDGGANSDFILTLVKGTPAAYTAEGRPADDDEAPEVEPFAGVAPAVPANALAIAQVTVPGGAANLNGATISTVSGLLTPTVGDGSIVKRRSAWYPTNGAGYVNVAFDTPFPHNFLGAIASSGNDSGGSVDWVVMVAHGYCTPAMAVFLPLKNGAGMADNTLNFAWEAWGN